MRVITISREFGSGGRELGKRLADELGYAYYDKEIIAKIAEELEMDQDYVEHMLSSGIHRTFTITYGASFLFPSYFQNDTTQLLLAQQKILKRVALEENCVIVGSSANVILDEQHSFDVFVYADMESKVKRCLERALPEEELDEAKVKKMIKKIDKARMRQHELHSDIKWGDRHGYHLCVDTSNVSIKEMTHYVAEYAKMWFKEQDKLK